MGEAPSTHNCEKSRTWGTTPTGESLTGPDFRIMGNPVDIQTTRAADLFRLILKES